MKYTIFLIKYTSICMIECMYKLILKWILNEMLLHVYVLHVTNSYHCIIEPYPLMV